jgi:hypothetical protein
LANKAEGSLDGAYSEHTGETASSGVIKDISKTKPVKKMKIILKKK